MEESTSSVRVNIYGDEYPIKGAADPKYIQKLAEYVDSQMRDVSDRASPRDKTKVAILAAINIANELFGIKEERSDVGHKLEKINLKTEELTEQINNSLDL